MKNKTTDLKAFLNENQPNNILNYIDPKKGFDTSYSDWYTSDIRNSNSIVYSTVYKVILTKPRIQWWVTEKIDSAANMVLKMYRKVLK